MNARSDVMVKVAQADADVARCFQVMKVLRPSLRDSADLIECARRQNAESGWRLIYVEDGADVVGCASFRIMEFLAWGKTIYVDDLVVLESHRGKGFAGALLEWIKEHGQTQGCAELHLDSGTHRLAAHRFYHRTGFSITSFHFSQKLSGRDSR